MTVHELKALYAQSEPFMLIDVRDHHEFEFNRLPDAHHIPLSDILNNTVDLPQNRLLILYCHLGYRSAHACQLLKLRGFGTIENLTGGIDAWAQEIDPGVGRY